MASGRGTKSDYRASRGIFEEMSEDRSRADYKSGKSLRILVVEDHSDTIRWSTKRSSNFSVVANR